MAIPFLTASWTSGWSLVCTQKRGSTATSPPWSTDLSNVSLPAKEDGDFVLSHHKAYEQRWLRCVMLKTQGFFVVFQNAQPVPTLQAAALDSVIEIVFHTIWHTALSLQKFFTNETQGTLSGCSLVILRLQGQGHNQLAPGSHPWDYEPRGRLQAGSSRRVHTSVIQCCCDTHLSV